MRSCLSGSIGERVRTTVEWPARTRSVTRRSPMKPQPMTRIRSPIVDMFRSLGGRRSASSLEVQRELSDERRLRQQAVDAIEETVDALGAGWRVDGAERDVDVLEAGFAQPGPEELRPHLEHAPFFLV